MNDLCQLIQETESPNRQKREAAENKLLEARDQSPDIFALRCSEEFKNNQLPDLLKPKAGILIKYTLLYAPTGADGLWKSFNADIKQQIKANLLEISQPTDPIITVAADLIAMIYLIELSWNGWPTLFSVLIQNLNTQDKTLKKSSILVLAKICDQAKDRKISLHSFSAAWVNQDILNLILDTLLHLIRENGTDDSPLKLPILSAVDSSLTFFREKFETQSGIRNEVLKFLLEEVSSKKLNFSAMQCLVQFVTISSHYLKECWQHIWEATSTKITENDAESAVLAIEIWQTVVQQEKQRTPQEQILREVSKGLVPALFENLLDEQKYQDDEESTIINSTKACFISLAQAMDETFFESAVVFVQKHLWNENLVEKRAGLIVYSCMLDCPKPQLLAAFITQALPTVADILFNSDNSEILKQEASHAFQRAFGVLPELFLNGNLLNSRLQDLTHAIKAPSKISVNIANFWRNLGQFIADNNN